MLNAELLQRHNVKMLHNRCDDLPRQAITHRMWFDDCQCGVLAAEAAAYGWSLVGIEKERNLLGSGLWRIRSMTCIKGLVCSNTKKQACESALANVRL